METVKVNKILPIYEVQNLVIDVDRNDLRALTSLRNKLENSEAAANAVLRETFILYERGCICSETVYVIAGISFQNGASICAESFNCISDEEVIEYIKMMSNVNTHAGICPLPSEIRNWLASLLNRNDGWEGGINPIPEVYMKDIKGNVYRSVSSGSHHFYEGMIHYIKKISCDLKNFTLQELVIMGMTCMDLTPILYAIKEGGRPLKKFTEELIQKVEPKDPCSREGLINLAKIVKTMEVC